MRIGMFDDKVMLAMERYLDLAARRHEVISGNLANIDTPNFRALDLLVEPAIRSMIEPDADGPQLRRASTRHIGRADLSPAEAEVIEVQGLPLRNDLNNVDLDREMLKMAQNSLQFSLFAQLLRNKFRQLQYAINEGRF